MFLGLADLAADGKDFAVVCYHDQDYYKGYDEEWDADGQE